VELYECLELRVPEHGELQRVPAGHFHGLRAGAGGMLESGVRSPPDPTAAPVAAAARPVDAFAALRLGPRAEQELRAVASPCLLLAVRARADT
jgi:hypothetical protein